MTKDKDTTGTKKMRKILIFIAGLISGLLLIYTFVRPAWIKEGKKSAKIQDICLVGKQIGQGANYELGYKFETYYCEIVTGKADFREDWQPEGDWDYCQDLNEDGDLSDEGECKPAARNSEWVDR